MENSRALAIQLHDQFQTGIFELNRGEEHPRLDLHSGHFRDEVGVPNALAKYRADSICVGIYTHVFVDPTSNKPVTIPDMMRKSLERILISD